MFEVRRFRTSAAVIIVGLSVFLAFLSEPKSPSARDPATQIEEPRGAYEGSVTCEADCQVTFGLDKLETEDIEFKCNSEQVGTYNRPLNVVESDLLAQEKMAYWTRVIGFFTAAGLAILYVTFGATRDAVIETRKIGEAQTRGYLVLQPKWVSFDRNDTIWFACELSAIGNTPLTNVSVTRQYYFFGNNGREALGNPGVHPTSSARGHTLVPGHNPTFDCWGLHCPNLITRLTNSTDPKRPTLKVLVEVYIAWLDVFRREHEIKFEVEAWFMAPRPHSDVGPHITKIHQEKIYQKPRFEKWERKVKRWERIRDERAGLISRTTLRERVERSFNRFRGWLADLSFSLFGR